LFANNKMPKNHQKNRTLDDVVSAPPVFGQKIGFFPIFWGKLHHHPLPPLTHFAAEEMEFTPEDPRKGAGPVGVTGCIGLNTYETAVVGLTNRCLDGRGIPWNSWWWFM
jgi:hypothetical protein